MYLLNEMLMMTPVVVYVGLRLRSLRLGRRGANRYAFFARAGITLLRDEVNKIDGILYLAGRDAARPARGPARSVRTVGVSEIMLVEVEFRGGL